MEIAPNLDFDRLARMGVLGVDQRHADPATHRRALCSAGYCADYWFILLMFQAARSGGAHITVGEVFSINKDFVALTRWRRFISHFEGNRFSLRPILLLSSEYTAADEIFLVEFHKK